MTIYFTSAILSILFFNKKNGIFRTRRRFQASCQRGRTRIKSIDAGNFINWAIDALPAAYVYEFTTNGDPNLRRALIVEKIGRVDDPLTPAQEDDSPEPDYTINAYIIEEVPDEESFSPDELVLKQRYDAEHLQASRGNTSPQEGLSFTTLDDDTPVFKMTHIIASELELYEDSQDPNRAIINKTTKKAIRRGMISYAR